MNSRERIAAVLEHRLPDRVPLGELWIDPSVVEAVHPGGDWNDLVEHLDMDVVTAPTMIYEEHEVEWVDREKGIFRDKWGALQISRHDGVPVPTKPPRIETAEDLASYRPPDPADSPVIEKIRRLKQRYPNGEKAICCVGESGWAPAVFLRGGLENLLLDFALRPEFVKDLMKIGAEYYGELYRLVVPAGADVVLLGDDYSDKNGPMMSPRQFAELILPSDAAVVAAIKRAGAYAIKHIDGDIRKIMDPLVGTGLDCLGPLEPVPGMELAPILKRYPGKITVMGNLSIDLLSRGSEEDVIREVKRTLATVSAAGPHIMSSANTITSSVKPENFLAMIRTTKEFGQYPIDADRLLAEVSGC
ncbi:MAG: uroporphyrinogen decarboxylase family protein [Planctomycetota bacterium]